MFPASYLLFLLFSYTLFIYWKTKIIILFMSCRCCLQCYFKIVDQKQPTTDLNSIQTWIVIIAKKKKKILLCQLKKPVTLSDIHQSIFLWSHLFQTFGAQCNRKKMIKLTKRHQFLAISLYSIATRLDSLFFTSWSAENEKQHNLSWNSLEELEDSIITIVEKRCM